MSALHAVRYALDLIELSSSCEASVLYIQAMQGRVLVLTALRSAAGVSPKRHTRSPRTTGWCSTRVRSTSRK